MEARFGLDPELVERLKAENILYDRDGEGEYFQLYSGTYGEDFFFEVVERRSYRGYGAPNAIFRIVALKKQMRPEGRTRAGSMGNGIGGERAGVAKCCKAVACWVSPVRAAFT